MPYGAMDFDTHFPRLQRDYPDGITCEDCRFFSGRCDYARNTTAAERPPKHYCLSFEPKEETGGMVDEGAAAAKPQTNQR